VTLYYFDADAQVKYFVNESGSAWIRRQIDETVDYSPSCQAIGNSSLPHELKVC